MVEVSCAIEERRTYNNFCCVCDGPLQKWLIGTRDHRVCRLTIRLCVSTGQVTPLLNTHLTRTCVCSYFVFVVTAVLAQLFFFFGDC